MDSMGLDGSSRGSVALPGAAGGWRGSLGVARAGWSWDVVDGKSGLAKQGGAIGAARRGHSSHQGDFYVFWRFGHTKTPWIESQGLKRRVESDQNESPVHPPRAGVERDHTCRRAILGVRDAGISRRPGRTPKAGVRSNPARPGPLSRAGAQRAPPKFPKRIPNGVSAQTEAEEFRAPGGRCRCAFERFSGYSHLGGGKQ